MTGPIKQTCPVCDRKIRLTRGHRIWSHQRPATDEEPDSRSQCEGSGEMSRERSERLGKAEAMLQQAQLCLDEAVELLDQEERSRQARGAT